MIYTQSDSMFRLNGAEGGSRPYCVYEPYINNFVNPRMVMEKYILGENTAIAYQLEEYDSIGMDCVARCVNSILTSGAIPESFVAEVPDAFVEKLTQGFTEGCIQGCCSMEIRPTAHNIITGVARGIYDVSEERYVVKAGDRLIGLLSSGLHNEDLVKAIKVLRLDEENIADIVPEIFCKMRDELFRTSKIYVGPVLHLTRKLGIKIHGLCHTDGKGFTESLLKMLPEGIKAKVWSEDFPMSGIFDLIAKRGNFNNAEMFDNFNMGIGLVMAVDKEDAGHVMSSLIQMGEHPYVIGCCVEGDRGVDLVW